MINNIKLRSLLAKAASIIQGNADELRRSQLDGDWDTDEIALAIYREEIAVAAQLKRLINPDTEQRTIEKHAAEELRTALQALNAGMYAKAEYHAQGAQAACHSLAMLKRNKVAREVAA